MPATVSTRAPSPDLLRAVALHGIGRGEFAALVFSGSRTALGDIPGHHTWDTARKFALPDPRLPAEDDFARSPGNCLPIWPADRVRPTPGVCFVLSDSGHPALETLRVDPGVPAAGDLESWICLDRFLPGTLLDHRLADFLAAAGPAAPLVILGFGDQGLAIANRLAALEGNAFRILVHDASPERLELARASGFQPIALDDIPDTAAIISSPLARPAAFAPILDSFRESGLATLDNSLGWDGRPYLRGRGGRLLLSPAADRALAAVGSTIRAHPHGLGLSASVTRHDTLRLASLDVPCLRSGFRVALSSPAAHHDLAAAPEGDTLASLFRAACRAYIALDGQSNHDAAAHGIFAARDFLAAFWPDTITAIFPSETRPNLGSLPGSFEDLLARAASGRALASTFMTVPEQAAIGILAHHYAADPVTPIIEIGSALGGSAALMAVATAATRPPIISIDPDAPTRPAMRLAFDLLGHSDRLSQIVKTSSVAVGEVGRIVSKWGGAGLVFIDGLHTESAVAEDFDNYAPIVRPGGCLAFHDADARFSGILRVLIERVIPDPRFRPVCMVDTLAVFERTA